MPEIAVVAEHRAGEVLDVTYQMLNRAGELCRRLGHRLTVTVLCEEADALIRALEGRADEIIVYEDPRLEHFDTDTHASVLAALVGERRPLVTFLGHTAWSMDLAPALAVRTGLPLATDCVDVTLDVDPPQVVRQVYNGKMLARLRFRPSEGYVVTIRPGSRPATDAPGFASEVTHAEVPPLPEARRQFAGYQDTGKGDVDISQAGVLVSVGRGIGDQDNIEPARELAALLGGALSCSRPVVDKQWLPKYHQVGTSGKTVKPKIYLALGISGAFQHVAGIAGADMVIAVNRDRKAPIFRIADYGAVADAVDMVTALKDGLKQ
jgi:electron transfer flavoprotein alpha subunit